MTTAATMQHGFDSFVSPDYLFDGLNGVIDIVVVTMTTITTMRYFVVLTNLIVCRNITDVFLMKWKGNSCLEFVSIVSLSLSS